MTVYYSITAFPNLKKLLKFDLKPNSKHGFFVYERFNSLTRYHVLRSVLARLGVKGLK